MSGEPNKTTGQFHSIKGTAVEAVGDIIGSKSWQESGKQEHAKGEGEYNAARATDYVKGAGDRVKGMKDAIIGSLTGDKTQQAQGNVQHDKGKAQQDLNT